MGRTRRHPSPHAVEQLTAFFDRNGYVRVPDSDRRADTPRSYKKGYEVRLVANSAAELRTIRRLLKAAGFPLASPFTHAKQWRQPLYGQEDVSRFLAMIGRTPVKPPAAPPPWVAATP